MDGFARCRSRWTHRLLTESLEARRETAGPFLNLYPSTPDRGRWLINDQDEPRLARIRTAALLRFGLVEPTATER